MVLEKPIQYHKCNGKDEIIGMDKNIYIKILKLIERKGTRFTTEDLARELGTSKRTIYTYFSSKEEMLEKTIDFVFADITQMDQDIMDNKKLSLKEKIEQSISAIPDAYNIGAIIQHTDDLERYYPGLWTKVSCYLDSMWDSLINVINQGVQKGELEAVDTNILKLILRETSKKLLDYRYLLDNHGSFETGIQAMTQIVLYGIFKR